MKSWGTLAEELPHLIRRWEQRMAALRLPANPGPEDYARAAVHTASLVTLLECAAELRVYLEQCRDGTVETAGAECELCAGTGCMILSGRRCYACNGTGRGEGDGAP